MYRMAQGKLWGLAPLTIGYVISLLSGSLVNILVNLKQRFKKCIHKALSHKSSLISCVDKLLIQNSWLNCGVRVRVC